METPPTTKYQFTTVYGLLMIEAKNISYLQAQNNYALLSDSKGNDHFILHSLKQAQLILDHPSFFKVHKSYIVNTHQIYQFHKKGEGKLVLRCGARIPIGRTFRTELLAKLQG